MPASAAPGATATYNLGEVQPHVRAAAEYFGPSHNITNVGGWRATGSVPNSDHPKGLALDFMTRSKQTGDQLVRDLMDGAKTWGIKYIIWYRQIWHASTGKWTAYSGPSPHTDHVHASFLEKPGGKLPDPGGVVGGVIGALPSTLVGALNRLGDQVSEAAKPLVSVGKLADMAMRLFLPNNIVRAAAGIGGTIFVLIGIYFLSREVRSQ